MPKSLDWIRSRPSRPTTAVTRPATAVELDGQTHTVSRRTAVARFCAATAGLTRRSPAGRPRGVCVHRAPAKRNMGVNDAEQQDLDEGPILACRAARNLIRWSDLRRVKSRAADDAADAGLHARRADADVTACAYLRLQHRQLPCSRSTRSPSWRRTPSDCQSWQLRLRRWSKSAHNLDGWARARQTTEIRSTNRLAYLDAHATPNG